MQFRRRLHEWPEIGNELPVTREQVLAELEGLPLDVTLHETTSGVAALLTGERPGPTILLRGDMDALPLHEDTDLDFTSRVEGAMHACGHDTHTAMLAGGGQAAGRPSGRAGRAGAVHVPARRGGRARGAVHARRGPARRAAAGRRHRVPGRRRLRPAHHVGPAVRLGEHTGRGGDGVRRPDRHAGDRPGRPRQRAVPRPRSDPDRLRDGAGAADDGHPDDRRVRPVGGDDRADHGRHDEQHHPGGRRHRGHDPGRERGDPQQGARRDPARGRRHRRRPRGRGRPRDRARLPGDVQRRHVRRHHARRRLGRSSGPTRWCACRTR